MELTFDTFRMWCVFTIVAPLFEGPEFGGRGLTEHKVLPPKRTEHQDGYSASELCTQTEVFSS